MKREPRLARAFQPENHRPAAARTELRLVSNQLQQDLESRKGFDALDGFHSLQSAVESICVLYPVRELGEGQVSYFNFELAREMGLIPADHPSRMTRELEAKLIKTFSIRIINEYDQKVAKKFSGQKARPFMATRYLQLQHENKLGKTSGDGRSIWNGQVTHQGITWDVSSRGTGVTCLAPGAVEAGKPLKSGSTKFGYGCGMAEIDELYGTAIMSEIFHRQGLPTERVLCIIDIGKGLGIGVRAHKNLIRPAHLFALLKQSDYKNLRRLVDFVIDRQVANGDWKVPRGSQRRYDAFLEYVTQAFAKLVARLEVDYIFVWLDWDGDNILIDGSIIDYGSVRQFGLRHDQYRYEDVDRFSTNLLGQKSKARQIVQVFAQLTDYLKTGRKKKLAEYGQSDALRRFDQVFEQSRDLRICELMGLSSTDAGRLLKRHRSLFAEYVEGFQYFESAKISGEPEKLPDGVNRPALFNMRTFSREIPKLLREHDGAPVPSEILFGIILAEAAPQRDRKMTTAQDRRLMELQILYLEIMDKLRGRRSLSRFLNETYVRAKNHNRQDRLTGNGITVVVDELMTSVQKGLRPAEVQKAIEGIVAQQVNPGSPLVNKGPRKLILQLANVLKSHSEDI